jgi:hypothetical protein
MSTPTLSYPFDPTGQLASNLITNEQVVISAVNYQDYHFVVPRLAPYFLDSMRITLINADGTTRPMVMGVDWYGCFEFISASRACAKPIWGGVSILNTQLSGVLVMQYQTLGGVWTIDEQKIAELLAYNLHDPRVTAWEQVVEQPIAFPPIDHEWDLVDLVGATEVVSALTAIQQAILAQNGGGLAQHLADFGNPHHVTAAQTGLGNVQNFGIATLQDMTNGTSNQLYVTPYLVAQAINGAAGPGAALQTHINDHTNPHAVTAAQVNAYDIPTMNNLLAGKLGPNDTAGDSLKFNGMDQNQYAQFVLAQTAANSVLFDGLTVGQLTNQVLQGTAANSNQLGGRTYAQVISDTLAGKCADTFEFSGMDAPTYAAWVLNNGTASNASKVNGLSPTDFATWVLTQNGPAANASELGGLTLTQVISAASTAASGAKQTDWPATTGEALTDYWQELAQIVIPANATVAKTYQDTQWMLSMGDSNGAALTPVYYVRISVRGTSPNQVSFDVVSMNEAASAYQLGYTIENIDPGTGTAVPTVRVWLHTGPNMGLVSATALSVDQAKYIANNRVGVAPTSIAYLTPDTFARISDVNTVINSMTTMFNNLSAQLASS